MRDQDLVNEPWPKLEEDLSNAGEPPFGLYVKLDETTPMTKEQWDYMRERLGKSK